MALGYVAAQIASSVGQTAASALGQHVGGSGEDDSEDFGSGSSILAAYNLRFTIGGTEVFYGPLFTSAISLGTLLLAAAVVLRHRNRMLGVCPACASRIPHESTQCAYCGSDVSSGEP